MTFEEKRRMDYKHTQALESRIKIEKMFNKATELKERVKIPSKNFEEISLNEIVSKMEELLRERVVLIQ